MDSNVKKMEVGCKVEVKLEGIKSIERQKPNYAED